MNFNLWTGRLAVPQKGLQIRSPAPFFMVAQQKIINSVTDNKHYKDKSMH